MNELAPARIRVTAQNYVFLDCDVQTLVLHLLFAVANESTPSPAGIRSWPKSAQLAKVMAQLDWAITVETTICVGFLSDGEGKSEPVLSKQIETIEPEREDEE